ncbi:MAG: MBL fold metallo-hydrolase [Pseudomonadales bacterium]|jgi:glyoxylase-like metal-dependent hydrolase (beta-lactamase superfamily II)
MQPSTQSPYLTAIAAWLIAAAAYAAPAGDRFAEVEITAEHVAGSVFMLAGAGGNIGVSVGADGTLIIDDQYAPLAERIQSALDGIGGGRPKLVLNTHYHGDHTGSNAFFGNSGTIIAQDNVRLRLLDMEDIDRAALPLVTFEDHLTVHFNGDDIAVIHLPQGHTDGDSIVWFKQANVIHMGDLLFVDQFPYVDLDAGGSVDGYVRNLTAVLQMVPNDIHVIPGHGPLTDRSAIRRSLAMIEATRAVVMEARNEGLEADAIVARGLPAEWASFGTGFIDQESWIRTLLSEPR